MLDKESQKAEIARQTDPVLLANSFLQEDDCYIHIVGDVLGKHENFYTLRKWRGEYFLWRGGSYRHVSDDAVTVNVTSYLQRVQVNMRVQHAYELKITRNLVTNILLNIDPMILIRETCELNSWLDGQERPHVIPVRNGLLSLEDFDKGKVPLLIEHTPNYFSLVRLPFDYDPEARCPVWLTFIKDITQEDAELIRVLQAWVGYLLRPDLHEQKFLLCVGEGANGKGVFADVVQELVGRQNCSQVGLARFGNPFALYSTLGKVVNVTSESSHIIEEEAESVLKSFVAGDQFTFERKFREPVSAVPTAKIMISTNALPRFNDRTIGIWRRILLVPFEKTIPEERQVKELAAEIKATELPGIFNWALAGLRDLNCAGRFVLPKKSDQLLEEYRRDSDPTRAFLLENYTFFPNADGAGAADVYAAYREFCTANGCQPMNERNFGRQVRRIFPGVERRRPGTRGNQRYQYEGLVSQVSQVTSI